MTMQPEQITGLTSETFEPLGVHDVRPVPECGVNTPHTWTDADGGMLICARCEATRFSDEWGR